MPVYKYSMHAIGAAAVHALRCSAPFWEYGSMSLSLVQGRALLGPEAVQVTVEVHLANGLPSFGMVAT